MACLLLSDEYLERTNQAMHLQTRRRIDVGSDAVDGPAFALADFKIQVRICKSGNAQVRQLCCSHGECRHPLFTSCTMNLPDNFGLELASRLALHEALLENLYTNLLRKMPDAQERWKSFEDMLVQSLGELQPPSEMASDEERQWLEQQRAASQNLAQQFVARVASNQGWSQA